MRTTRFSWRRRFLVPMTDVIAATESWASVVGYVGVYSVSDRGSVRRDSSGRILRASTDRDGYRQVSLCVGGCATTRKVHHLVAEAFLGAGPVGHEINHENGLKDDNRPDNLEWVTHEENMAHASSRGLMRGPVGERSSTAKLKRPQVEDILNRLIETDETIDDVALSVFGSKEHTYYMRIYRIAKRSRWRHVICDEAALAAAVKRKKHASRHRHTAVPQMSGAED